MYILEAFELWIQLFPVEFCFDMFTYRHFQHGGPYFSSKVTFSLCLPSLDNFQVPVLTVSIYVFSFGNQLKCFY
jgi:hypothetical protein